MVSPRFEFLRNNVRDIPSAARRFQSAPGAGLMHIKKSTHGIEFVEAGMGTHVHHPGGVGFTSIRCILSVLGKRISNSGVLGRVRCSIHGAVFQRRLRMLEGVHGCGHDTYASTIWKGGNRGVGLQQGTARLQDHGVSPAVPLRCVRVRLERNQGRAGHLGLQGTSLDCIYGGSRTDQDLRSKEGHRRTQTRGKELHRAACAKSGRCSILYGVLEEGLTLATVRGGIHVCVKKIAGGSLYAEQAQCGGL